MCSNAFNKGLENKNIGFVMLVGLLGILGRDIGVISGLIDRLITIRHRFHDLSIYRYDAGRKYKLLVINVFNKKFKYANVSLKLSAENILVLHGLVYDIVHDLYRERDKICMVKFIGAFLTNLQKL